MAGKLNGTVKQWWPVVLAVVMLAAGWGTLRADVTHNRNQVVSLQDTTTEIRRSLAVIERAVATIEGMLRGREDP